MAGAAAVLLALFYLVSSIYIAAHRPLWFDEIVTVLFARLPNIVTIWKAVKHVDPWGMPPAYYALIHVFQGLPGRAEITARVPSSLAVAAGLLITFDCTRRLTNGLHGLIALTFLTCSFLPYYGFEARSYGICFMLASLSFWVWCHTREASRLSAAVYGGLFFCAFMMHPYTALGIVPYGLYDFVRRSPGRLVSYKTIAGVAGIFCGAALLSVDMIAASSGPRTFSGQHPSPAALGEAFSQIFPSGLFLISAAIVWIILTSRGNEALSTPPARPAERLGWLFLIIPFAGFLLAEAVTKAFVARYFIGILPGIAVAASCLLSRYGRGNIFGAAGIFVALTAIGLTEQINLMRHPKSIDPSGQQTQARQILDLEGTLLGEHKQFILITGTLLYMETEYYSKDPEVYRFLATDDPTNRMPVYFSEYYPSLKTWSLDDLKKHARETAVVSFKPDVIEALKNEGLSAQTRFDRPFRVTYFQ
ncbi:MAG: glycosyltransferase family 39 protein [Terriglobia bacterium]